MGDGICYTRPRTERACKAAPEAQEESDGDIGAYVIRKVRAGVMRPPTRKRQAGR